MRHASFVRPGLVRALAAALFVGGVWLAFLKTPAYTQTPTPTVFRPATSQKIKDNLYLIQGEGGNVAALITDEGILLVDDMYDRDYQTVMDAVKKLSDKPVRYVLNTHHHDDHAGANKSMDKSVQLVSHENARRQMQRLNQPGWPSLTFEDQMQIHLGGQEIRAYHFGRGHTNGDVIVFFPALKTIHSGDIFLNNASPTRPAQPYMDYAAGGSALEWTHVMDEMAKLDFDTIIPGHGPLSDRKGLAAWYRDFVTLRERIRDMVQRGESKEAVTQVLYDEFKWPKGGLAIYQVDAFMAEMKTAAQ